MEKNIPRQPIIVALHGAAATDDERCSKIALSVLRGTSPFSRPGNAVDAAIAAALALGVVSPASSGLGGGDFMVLRLANGTTKAFDMRETAPLEASTHMYDENPDLKTKGPLSIAVPGDLAGLYEVWKQHGTLPWESLVTPAMELALGFKISDYLYWEMHLMESAIREDVGLSSIFIKNGKLLQAGEVCRNIKLAETLAKIAKLGMKAIYDGPVGQDLTKDIQERGGIIKMKDLESYTLRMRKPIIANVAGQEIICMPPPSAGGAGLVLMLNILAQYGLPLHVVGNLGIHREIECLKHIFAVKMNIGDPDYVDVAEVIHDMLSVKFAKELKAAINDDRTYPPEHYGGKWNELHQYQMHEHGTRHLCVVDNQGNAVALTSSLNYYFGSGILSPRTGIILNNTMDDFSIPPHRISGNRPNTPANFISPGKRPLSCMSPTIVLKNGKLKAVLGGAGGRLIIPGVSEVFLNHFAKRMDQLRSVKAPRVYHQLIPNEVHYENLTTVTHEHIEVPLETRLALMAKGHVLKKIDVGASCQIITLKELLKGKEDLEEIVAVSDPRQGGFPAGY